MRPAWLPTKQARRHICSCLLTYYDHDASLHGLLARVISDRETRKRRLETARCHEGNCKIFF